MNDPLQMYVWTHLGDDYAPVAIWTGDYHACYFTTNPQSDGPEGEFNGKWVPCELFVKAKVF